MSLGARFWTRHRRSSFARTPASLSERLRWAHFCAAASQFQRASVGEGWQRCWGELNVAPSGGRSGGQRGASEVKVARKSAPKRRPLAASPQSWERMAALGVEYDAGVAGVGGRKVCAANPAARHRLSPPRHRQWGAVPTSPSHRGGTRKGLRYVAPSALQDFHRAAWAGGQNLADIELGPNLVEFGQIRSKFGRCQATSGKLWSK